MQKTCADVLFIFIILFYFCSVLFQQSEILWYITVAPTRREMLKYREIKREYKE